MKIAFLSFYSGIVERGVETLVPQIAMRLAKNHKVVVYQGGETQTAIYEVRHISTSWRPNILEEPLTIKKRLFLDKSSLAVCEFTKKTLPSLKAEKFDIIVPWNNGWQTLFCKTAGVGKVVVVGQSGLGWDDRVNLWLFPDRFVGFTRYQCNWAHSVNPFVKTTVIPNGVDTSVFKPDGTRVKFDFPPPIILCVAALVPLKRLHLAIKAVSGLEKGSLVLVGRGELKDELQHLGDSLLPNRFKIMEAHHRDIHKVYRSADLFTFPTSPWESFGIAMLEAMASGLPVVANDDPIRREIVGNAGLFVDPTDTNVYTQTLKEALSKKWGETPRRQAEKFSWDDIARKYELLFQELVSTTKEER